MGIEGPEGPLGVVVNPSSAMGHGRRVAAKVLARFRSAGHEGVEILGRDAESCRAAILEACATGVRGLVLVGGDGLIGLTVQLPEARALPIGVVPAGSGNDFARHFGLARRPDLAVRRILATEAEPRAVDLGVVTLPVEDPPPAGALASRHGLREHWFACGLSIGFDAGINRRANSIRLPIGPIRYHLALLLELMTLRSRPLAVEFPDGDAEGGAFTGLLATAMNTRVLGGGIPLAPSASAEDGFLEFVEVVHASRARVLSLLLVLARGRHGRLPEVRITRTRRVRVEAGAEVAYADGDRVGAGPFDIRVEPRALRLLG